MKNLFVLPTDKPSRLHTDLREFFLTPKYQIGKEINSIVESRNIYITNDERIKEGGWFYNTISLKPEPFKACENGDGYVNCSRYSHNRIDCKKIILTTDQDLIKDGIQAIDDEFLEWFVKNPSCEEVEIEESTLLNTSRTYLGVDKYKIIIPKEEPKQETFLGKTISKKDADKDSFEDVTKYKIEKGYSEEDMKQYAFQCVANFLSNNDNKVEIELVEIIIDRNKNVFEQFKNK